MKLYLIHCGFYDSEVCDGIYESHINLFAVAQDIEDAKKIIRQNRTFREKKMHIDGMQEILAVDGHQISVTENCELKGESRLVSNLHRDL